MSEQKFEGGETMKQGRLAKLLEELDAVRERASYLYDSLRACSKADFNEQLEGEINSILNVFALYGEDILSRLENMENDFREYLERGRSQC